MDNIIIFLIIFKDGFTSKNVMINILTILLGWYFSFDNLSFPI